MWSKSELPNLTTRLIGREREVAEVSGLLMHPDIRLLTLTGSAGTGKTRLCLQVANELRDIFPDGLFFVSLASLNDPAQVGPAIAQVMGVKDSGNLPVDENLNQFLEEKELLLILDNFEQVIGAAGLLADLLAVAPGLKILVTSREVLHVYGEQEYQVQPLAIPPLSRVNEYEPSELLRFEAINLFVLRTQAVRPDFQLTRENAPAVVEICARLDGLPLAIELAAARGKFLSPQALLNRLDKRLQILTGGARDLPRRQQTLRDAIGWSYGLLDEREKRLFARLGAFLGGWTLEAVETICHEPGEDNLAVLECLGSLVDKSLVRQLEPPQAGAKNLESRFGMLETLREYAQDKLLESEQANTIRERHARYFLKVAEAAKKGLQGADQLVWLERVEAEHDNVRVALDWLLEVAPAQAPAEKAGEYLLLAARMGVALGWFWYTYGYLGEGRHWLELILEKTGALTRWDKTRLHPVQAEAWFFAGMMARNQGDFRQAEIYCERSLDFCRALDDKPGILDALYGVGAVAWAQGDFVKARGYLEESLEVGAELNDTWSMARSYHGLGEVESGLAQYDRAATAYKGSLRLFRQVGDPLHGVFSMLRLGFLAWIQGNWPEASERLQESLQLFRQVRNNWGIAYSLMYLGGIDFDQGKLPEAETRLTESLVRFQQEGYRPGISRTLNFLGLTVFSQGRWREGVRHNLESLELRLSGGDKLGTIYSINSLALLSEELGLYEQSARLQAVMETYQEKVGTPNGNLYNDKFNDLNDKLVARLGKERFEQIWAESVNLPPEEVAEKLDFEKALTERENIQTGQAKNMQLPWFSGDLPAETEALPEKRGRNPQNRALDELTSREIEVLGLVAQGLSNTQVADKLSMAPRTVNVHLTSIYSKIGVTSRTAATRYALENHLVP